MYVDIFEIDIIDLICYEYKGLNNIGENTCKLFYRDPEQGQIQDFGKGGGSG